MLNILATFMAENQHHLLRAYAERHKKRSPLKASLLYIDLCMFLLESVLYSVVGNHFLFEDVSTGFG